MFLNNDGPWTPPPYGEIYEGVYCMKNWKHCFFVSVLMFVGGITIGAQQVVTGNVLYVEDVDIINLGRYRRFWMDTTGNGIEDSFLELGTQYSDTTLLSRYILPGGRVIFSKRADGGMGHNHRVIMYIIMPNTPDTPEHLRGKNFSIFDLFPGMWDSFPYAKEELERQNSRR
jgi:hypothetical protein